MFDHRSFGRRTRHIAILLGATCSLVAFAPEAAHAPPPEAESASFEAFAPQDKEYIVKAGMLRYFATCVKWPPTAMPKGTKEIVVGVLGSNPFEGCDAMLNKKPVRGMSLKINVVKSPADLAGAHIVFLSKSHEAKMGDLLKAVAGKNVLTVGESAAFGSGGGMINFVVEGGKIKFKLDGDAVKKGGLLVNPKLKKKSL